MYRPYTFPTFTYFNIIKLDDPKTSPPLYKPFKHNFIYMYK